MDFRTDDAPDEVAPPPGWILNTPTRHREVWTLPVLAVVLAGLLLALGTRFGTTLGLVVCLTCAVVVAAGAVVLAVAGRAAYEEQTLEASWRLHVVRLVVGVTTAAVVAVSSLLVGLPIGLLFASVWTGPMTFRLARSVPRSDRLVVAWASAAVTVACAVLVVLGLALPGLGRPQEITWLAAGPALGVLSLVMAVAQCRIAARTPRE